MARKLGYTFYTQDYRLNHRVLKLDEVERGFYRDLLDEAYLNDNKFDIDFDIWSRLFPYKKGKMNQMLVKLCDIGLLIFNEEYYSIPSVEPRINKKRAGKAGGQSTANGTALGTANGTANRKRKRKRNIKGSAVPTIEEVKDYFTSNGYSSQAAEKAWNYYEAGDWEDSHGNKVKSWKQKMRGVWFKDENKIQKQQSTNPFR